MSRFSQLLTLAEEDLKTSQLLLDNERYRVCISRAYYAMYYGAQALLKAKNVKSRTHKGLIQQFNQHFVKSGDLPIDMSKALSDNYDLRQLSDYEEAVVMNREQAEKALAASVRFIEQVRLYLDGAT